MGVSQSHYLCISQYVKVGGDIMRDPGAGLELMAVIMMRRNSKTAPALFKSIFVKSIAKS